MSKLCFANLEFAQKIFKSINSYQEHTTVYIIMKYVFFILFNITQKYRIEHNTCYCSSSPIQSSFCFFIFKKISVQVLVLSMLGFLYSHVVLFRFSFFLSYQLIILFHFNIYFTPLFFFFFRRLTQTSSFGDVKL